MSIFLFFILSLATAQSATIKETLAQLKVAHDNIVLILNNGYKCSKYIWPPENLPPQDRSPIKPEKLSGMSCWPMDSATKARLCNKSLNESTYDPLKKNVSKIGYEIKSKSCKDLPEIINTSVKLLSSDIAGMNKADERNYLKDSFTYETRYTKCSQPKNPKDPYSNIESGYYKSLRAALNSSLSSLQSLTKQSPDQLCKGR